MADTAEPFTPDEVLALIKGAVKVGHTPSIHKLAGLTRTLNRLQTLCRDSDLIKSSHKRALSVDEAFETLRVYIGERFRDLEALQEGITKSELFESERKLYKQFQVFRRAFDRHDFSLPMDVLALRAPIESWRTVAGAVVEPIRMVMCPLNGEKWGGLSNNGPLPRFVASAIPRITGESPSVENVAQHLKMIHRPPTEEIKP